MKLGFVSAILPELNLDQVLEFAAGEGFACVEIMCWPVGKAERKYAGVTHIDVAGFTKAQAEDVRARLERHKVGISGLGYYPNIPHGRPRAIALLHRPFEKSHQGPPGLLGLKNVNTFIGAEPSQNLEENFARFKKIWPAIIRYAEDQGVRIGIENWRDVFHLR